MSAPVFRTDRGLLVAGAAVELDGPEGRHAATVRRLSPGEPVVLTDGAGRAATTTVVAVGRDRVRLDVVRVEDVPRPTPRVTVVQALPKGDRGELAVETMTEVGVDRVVPWSAERCVTRWRDERGSRALERWRSTAREAAKQSRRTWWPEVAPLASTAEVATLLAGCWSVVLHEEAAVPLPSLAVPADGDLVLVVGPEGGLTDDELATFRAGGATAATLGPTVLRTSTAGLVAAAVVLARTDRWR